MKRNLDSLGRICIPIEYRREIGVDNFDEVEIELKGSQIILTNPKRNDIKDILINKLHNLKEVNNADDLDMIIKLIKEHL